MTKNQVIAFVSACSWLLFLIPGVPAGQTRAAVLLAAATAWSTRCARSSFLSHFQLDRARRGRRARPVFFGSVYRPAFFHDAIVIGDAKAN